MTAAVGATATRGAAGGTGKAKKAAEVAAMIPRGKTKRNGRGGGRGQRVLLAELLICVLLVGLHPLSRPAGEVTPGQWIKRATAISALFVGLGMVASIGPASQRAANAIGGLIALVLLIDQRSLFITLARKFNNSDKIKEETPASASGGIGG